jgi:protein SCO1/2
MGQRAFVFVLMMLLAGFAIGIYRASDDRANNAVPDSSMGTIWPEPRPLPDFKMFDHQERPFGLAELRGHWTLVFFGYTSCPDICPTTMMTLRGVMAELGDAENLPRVVLVSVDPERDDPATLASYVTYFGADFVGVRGPDDQLHKLALAIGAMYEREAPDENGVYDVAHSASIFLVDPAARMFAAFSPPHRPGDIAKRFLEIRRL